MWTRAELKERAKAVLRTNYWKAFIVALVMAILGTDGSSSSRTDKNYYYNMDPGELWFIVKIIGVILIVVLLLEWFVGHIIEVGGRKFFIRATEGESKINLLYKREKL